MQNAKKTPGVDSAESEGLYGYVFSVSGPVVVADHMTGAAMYELVSGNITLLVTPPLNITRAYSHAVRRLSNLGLI